MGVAVKVSVSTLTFSVEFVLDRNAEFLLLVDDHQAEVLELHVLTDQPMVPMTMSTWPSANALRVSSALWQFESIQILHAAGEVFQSVAEGAVVLKASRVVVRARPLVCCRSRL